MVVVKPVICIGLLHDVPRGDEPPGSNRHAVLAVKIVDRVLVGAPNAPKAIDDIEARIVLASVIGA